MRHSSLHPLPDPWVRWVGGFIFFGAGGCWGRADRRRVGRRVHVKIYSAAESYAQVRNNLEMTMNDQETEGTAAAQETEGVMTPAGGFATIQQAMPLRESHRNAVNALMGYFDAQGIPYRPRCEEIGICLTVGSDIPHWETSSRIRLGACTGVVTIFTWMEQVLLAPQYDWMAKRLVDAVNRHCEFAELGYDAGMRHIYARTQVWYADADLRPRDVEMAMRVTGVVLLRTLRELFEISVNRKRIVDSVEALGRWLEEEQTWAVVEFPEVQIDAADEAAI